MWEQIRANRRKSAALVVVMAGLLFVVGYAVGEALSPGSGLFGLFIAFVVWVVLSLISYFAGDQIFLTLSKAREIKKEDHPVLFNVVEEMKLASGLPKMPRIYIIDEAAPNAFATGRNPERASVAVTAGLLERLNRDELQGVIAHELGHVKNRDVLYMLMVGVMMGAIVLIADVGVRHLFWFGGGRRRTSSSEGGQGQAILMIVAVVLMILAPIIAQFVYFAISRKREYLADASAAQFTRYPEGLAGALEKISGTAVKMKSATKITAPMFIVNPLQLSASGMSKLSSTHPPTGERVKILRSMAGGAGFRMYDEAFRSVSGRPVGVIPAGSLAAAEEISIRSASEDKKKKQDRVRETTDLLWKLNKYLFIACACGTNLKIPAALSGRTIRCTHCGTEHKAEQKA